MTDLIPLYIAALKKVDWQGIDKFELSEDVYPHWLLEKGSLSRRFEEKCEELAIELLDNSIVSSDTLTYEEKKLLSDRTVDDNNYLLREVILYGDNQEWLIGRTFIPESSLEDQPYNLVQQGQTPLGLTVFSVKDVSRDALQFGWVKLKNQRLVARRSRIWMNQKPMLVTELFLPDSPIYLKRCLK